jgi:hypothetical protein
MIKTIEIYNYEDLLDIDRMTRENGADDFIFKIMNDINLGYTTWYPIGKVYDNPLPYPFCGEIQGQGHIIKNMVMERANLDSIGFICLNHGIVRDLYFDNTCNIHGKELLGTICAMNDGKIINCKSSTNLKGECNIGGICGFNYSSGEIVDCSFYGKIQGSSSNVRGIAGGSDGKIKGSSCYAIINEKSKVVER